MGDGTNSSTETSSTGPSFAPQKKPSFADGPQRDLPDLLIREQALWKRGISGVAGIDEAGRGPWAGPVVAACVVLAPGQAENLRRGPLLGLTDSKRLTPSARNRFFAILTSEIHIEWGTGFLTAKEIDRYRIHQATYRAMRDALLSLPHAPEHALVDGLPVPGLPCPSDAIVHGECISLSIAAASVLAKVTRDRMMQNEHLTHPEYGFDRNKGYGTAQHRKALWRFGPCSLHRFSFTPVKAAQAARTPNRTQAHPLTKGHSTAR